jgi:hypothetical protein
MRAEKIKILFLVISLVSAVIISGCKKQGDSNAASSPARDSNDTVVIAYYFHRTIRCVGCLEIETNAKRVIENNFANQIADEKLIWMPFNIDEQGGEEFAKGFDVSTSTLVLSKEKNGNRTEYKKLEKVWQLAHEPEAFDAYVKDEVRQFLNE